jgi:hypothetical protein
LIGLREFQQEKADIIHKYSADEARSLQAYGELPMHAKINQTAIDIAMVGGDGQEEDVGFDFEDASKPPRCRLLTTSQPQCLVLTNTNRNKQSQLQLNEQESSRSQHSK